MTKEKKLKAKFKMTFINRIFIILVVVNFLLNECSGTLCTTSHVPMETSAPIYTTVNIQTTSVPITASKIYNNLIFGMLKYVNIQLSL